METAALPAATACDIVSFLLHQCMQNRGPPQDLLSDQGGVFCLEVIKECFKECHAVLCKTTFRHLQPNGLTKRFNHKLDDVLSISDNGSAATECSP